MIAGRLRITLFVLIAAAASLAPIATAEAATPNATFATVGDETAIPYGWVDFCSRQPQECEQEALPAEDLLLTPKTWKLLRAVTKRVNAAIEPVSNLDHWGTLADHWDYPVDGKGDCKIYALEKRRQLIAAGVPRQALLMTIVRDHDNMGHAILTVRTNKGDFILDNLTDAVLPWSETGYRFVKRQSQEDPNVWLSLAPTDAGRIGAR
jgi:predicted transglutaminase-like cysteine proteinase